MRPEGFKNPMDDGRPSTVINDMRRRAYEAGADAMLEGLKKIGNYIDRDDSFTSLESGWTISIQGRGYLVFIQEEIDAPK